MAFSLQQAYDGAANGAVIQIPPGPLAVDDASRRAATIFGDTSASAKSVTFVGSADVQHPCKVLTIGASNVTLRAAVRRAWWVHFIMVGEGGDTAPGPSGVVIEGLHADAIEVVGSRATLRDCQFGPVTLGFVNQLDPNSSDPVERFYAANGGSNDIPDPYFHNNSGGARSKVLMEDCLITGYQTMDANALHTGGGIIWNPPGDPLDWTIIRRCVYERLAIQGLQTTETDGVTIEDCIFRGVYEPFSNVGKNNWVLAGPGQKELICHKTDNTLRRFRIRRNKFCQGIRPQFTASQDVVISDNDLGTGSQDFPGATYSNNTAQGSGCSGAAPPPPPPDPIPDPVPADAPPVFAGNFAVKSYTKLRVVIGWDAATDDKGIKEYRLYKDGAFVATAGPLAVQAKFSVDPVKAFHTIDVEAVDTIGQKVKRGTAVEYVNGVWRKHR